MNWCQGLCVTPEKIMIKARHALYSHGLPRTECPTVGKSLFDPLNSSMGVCGGEASREAMSHRVESWSDGIGVVSPAFSFSLSIFLLFLCPLLLIFFFFFYVCTHACEFMFFCVNPCGGLRLTTRRFLQSFSIFNFLVLLFLRQDLSDLGLKLTLTGEHLGHAGFDLDPSPWFQVW